MSRLHTYYDNLKVPRTASPEMIRAAYRRLSQKHHPDRHPDNPEAERIMVLINVAYRALSNPVRRAQHDRWIAEQEIISAAQPAGTYDSAEASLDPQRDPPKPRAKPRTRRRSDDIGTPFSEGLRQAIRGAFVYHALFLIVVPMLASLAMFWATPAAPIKPQPGSASLHQTRAVATPPRPAAGQTGLPDLSGTWRLIDSNLEHYGSPKPRLNKGKLVIRKLRDNVYLVLEATTRNQSGTFGYGHVFHARPSDDKPGKVVLSRSRYHYASSDGTYLEMTHSGSNFWSTTKWQRADSHFSEKYLDRGIKEAERYYQVHVEHGLEESFQETPDNAKN
jgi:hypothetical protein